MGVWEGRKKGKENKPKKKGGATEEWWEKNKLKNGEKILGEGGARDYHSWEMGGKSQKERGRK